MVSVPASERFQARLVASRVLSPSVRELTFERTDGATFRFRPGQWVNAFVPVGGADLKRAYSIASEPAESPRFSLAVTRVADGPVSSALHASSLGEVLTFVGASGHFTREASNPRPALFVGTGTGVTPFRSILRAALQSGSRVPVTLLLGVRREEDAIYRDEFVNLAAQHPHFRFDLTLSKPEANWAGRLGYVQEHTGELLQDLKARASDEPDLFVCGLVRMVKAIRDLARGDLRLPRERVHQERYD